MANRIITKNGTGSPTGGTADDELAPGELGLDTDGLKIYANVGGTTIKEVGAGGALIRSGGTMTGGITFTGFAGIDLDGGDIDVNGNELQDIGSIAFRDGDATITEVKDDDTMASASATKICTQQSIKAYADTKISTSSMLDQDDMSSNSASYPATQQSIKSYVDNKYQWVQFSSSKYSMTSTSAWYLGTKKVTTDATVTYDDIVPSMFEQQSLPLFQNVGTADVKVHRFRYFFVYDGTSSSDDLKINIYVMKGAGGTSDNEFHGATALASSGGLGLAHTITLTDLNDDMWHHYSGTFSGTVAGEIELEPGEIILPLIESSASIKKSIYLNCAYLVSGMGGDY